MGTKQIISSRYYPTYYGRRNTYRSYRSYRVGVCTTGTADRVIGYCSDSVPDGWVTGERGGYACRTFKPVASLHGYIPKK